MIATCHKCFLDVTTKARCKPLGTVPKLDSSADLMYYVIAEVVRVDFNIVNARFQCSCEELIVAHLVGDDDRATREFMPAIGAPCH